MVYSEWGLLTSVLMTEHVEKSGYDFWVHVRYFEIFYVSYYRKLFTIDSAIFDTPVVRVNFETPALKR